jgi:SpoIID/LytB domain protein
MGDSSSERAERALPAACWRLIGITASTYHRTRAPRTRRARPLGALACALASAALAAAPASASTLVIQGAGDGHGVGMSQDGALGMAVHGSSYQAILSHFYAGTTLGVAPARAVVRVLVGSKVKRVPLERYVRGVVSAEMPSSWPLAALEAQAIASRSYALTAHAGGSRFDVYSDTRSQMYVGVAAETAQTNTAVTATAGQIVLYAGVPATTYFFASSGGMTENIENAFLGAAPQPWLRGVADPYDGGASASWTRTMPFSLVAAKLRGLVKGSLSGIEVLSRGVSPRIVAAQVLGSGGATAISGPALAARLGLPSTWLYFSVQDGAKLTREPDRSRGTPAVAPATVPAPSPTAPQGGARAPGSADASAASTGGVAAE